MGALSATKDLFRSKPTLHTQKRPATLQTSGARRKGWFRMNDSTEVSVDEERLAAITLGLGSVRTWHDFNEALTLLAGRVRNVQQLERHPRHGESMPSDLTRSEEILRALHYALTAADEGALRSLHNAAIATLASDPGSDGRNAIGVETGLTTRTPARFGVALLATLVDFPLGLAEDAIVTHLANAPIWKDCPFPRLRTLIPGHRLHEPKLRAWVADQWITRTEMGPSDAHLARSLLEALGVSEAEALKVIPNGD